MIPVLARWGLRLLPYVAVIALVVALAAWVSHRGYQRGVASQQPTIAALNATIADVRLRTQQAKADDVIHAMSVERQQTAITQESSNALETQLAAARATARDYAARLRLAGGATANSGRGGDADLPRTADATGTASDAGPTAELDDATACAVAVTKAEGWLAWWNGQVAVVR